MHPPPRVPLCPRGLFVALTLSALLPARALAALKAAGFTGTAPAGADVIKQLIATLTANWEWLIATGIGLVLMILAGLLVFGSQRAPEHLFKVIAGIMLILIVIPAVLA